MTRSSTRKHRRPFRFVLMGASLDTGNMGVSALAASTIGLVRHHRPDAQVALFIGNRSAAPQSIVIKGHRHDIPVINYRWSPKAIISDHIVFLFGLALLWRLVPIASLRNRLLAANRRLEALATADLVGEVRGGDSFSDIYGLRRFMMGTLPLCIPMLLKRPVCFLPQTYGPFESSVSQHIAAFFMRRTTSLLSRDKESIPLIQELLSKDASNPAIQFCPDVAFTLETHEVKTPQIEPPLDLPPQSRLIGFNVNGLMYNGGYTRSNMFALELDYRGFALQLVKKLLADRQNHILLVPHTFGAPGSVNSDPDACRAVMQNLAEELKPRVHMVMREYDQSAIKSIIGQCHFFIGSRMHSCIAGLSQGIPTIGVAYSKKFGGVFNAVGVGEWVVDGRTEDVSSAIERISLAFDQTDRARHTLLNKVATAKQRIHDCFHDLLT